MEILKIGSFCTIISETYRKINLGLPEALVVLPDEGLQLEGEVHEVPDVRRQWPHHILADLIHKQQLASKPPEIFRL